MADISKEQMRERLGNIDQIRDLLFGQKIKADEERFERDEQRLEHLELELANFQGEMRDRLTQLQSELSTEIHSAVDSFEKKLRYFSLTTQDETSSIKQELKATAQRNSNSIDSLYSDVRDRTNAFQDELARTRQALQEDVQSLRNQVFEELEQGFTNLKDAKISRAELAEFLFELCFKVKGAEMVPELKEAEESLTKAELLLPEQQ